MLDFSRFEILTFDCYGTLINWEEGILGCLHRILAAHRTNKDTDDATILKLYGNFEASAEAGEYRPYREVLQSVVRQFGERLGFTPTVEEVRSLPGVAAKLEAVAGYGSRTQFVAQPFSIGRDFQCG